MKLEIGDDEGDAGASGGGRAYTVLLLMNSEIGDDGAAEGGWLYNVICDCVGEYVGACAIAWAGGEVILTNAC